MKIKWLAHASFLIEGDGLRIITDPFDPKDINVPPVTETADIVIRSSDDDIAHAHVDTIPPGFELITATDIIETGATVKGIKVDAIWSQESLIHKEVARDNAMYRFTVEGINITHMGDVGNSLTAAQMDALAGTDVLLALTGGPPTIDLQDLNTVIETIKPKLVIPMHYRIPGPKFHMLPVTDFTAYYADTMVDWSDSTEVELSLDSLPDKTRILILKPMLFRNEL
ncbi:MAG: MBL fold metallo-hydrolase [Chloroflexi bacterium]|nr:MBL fold metallo-hydrolase [Chloroflexota bacterium]